MSNKKKIKNGKHKESLYPPYEVYVPVTPYTEDERLTFIEHLYPPRPDNEHVKYRGSYMKVNMIKTIDYYFCPGNEFPRVTLEYFKFDLYFTLHTLMIHMVKAKEFFFYGQYFYTVKLIPQPLMDRILDDVSSVVESMFTIGNNGSYFPLLYVLVHQIDNLEKLLKHDFESWSYIILEYIDYCIEFRVPLGKIVTELIAYNPGILHVKRIRRTKSGNGIVSHKALIIDKMNQVIEEQYFVV
jgi:hypothetical protein